MPGSLRRFRVVILLPTIVLAAIAGPTTGRAENQVMVCHFPPGNVANPRTIVVGEAAVDAHIGHGDALGDCATDVGFCGDGIVQGSEGCDPPDFGDRTCQDILGDGATGEPACTPSCLLAPGTCQLCGNGIREGTEMCDDGNDIPNDACNLCVSDEDHED